MTPIRPAVRGVLSVCALTVLLIGCSDDGGSAETVGTASTTEESAGSTDESTTTEGGDDGSTTTTEEGSGPEPDGAEAEALAASVNIEAGDVADGWEESAPSTDNEDQLDPCFTSLDIEAAEVAAVTGSNFSLETDDGAGGQNISSSTIVVGEDSEADLIMDDLRGDELVRCFRDQLVDNFEEDGDVTVSEIQLDAAPGVDNVADDTAALNGTFTLVRDSGQTIDGEISVFFIRTGVVITNASVLDLGGVGIAATVDEVVGAVADKHRTEVG